MSRAGGGVAPAPRGGWSTIAMRHCKRLPEARRFGRQVAGAALLALGVAALLPGSARASGAPGASPASATADHAAICDQVGARAETASQLPEGLLRAIGRVESGRRTAQGGFAPWPWTLNANGQGRYFETLAEAAAAARGLQAAGIHSIDTGCFQVNLQHHPLAFRTVEDALDPSANATYAAAFLKALRARLGSWEAAVAAYHSATTERGEPYRARVYAAWHNRPSTAAIAAPRPIGPVVIRISGPDISAGGGPVRVWTPSAPGTAPARLAIPAGAMLPASLPPQPIARTSR